MSFAHKISILESLLFTSGEPLSFSRLAKILQVKESELETCVKELTEKYENDPARGLVLVVKDRKVMLVVKSENANFVEVLSKSVMQENLSQPALEVLAIIAYRAPITRAEIEAIRGVNCNFTLRNLLLRDLIERQGNPQDTRGYVYFPTFKFLQFLGAKDISELPDYETLSQDERLKTLITEDSQENND